MGDKSKESLKNWLPRGEKQVSTLAGRRLQKVPNKRSPSFLTKILMVVYRPRLKRESEKGHPYGCGETLLKE